MLDEKEGAPLASGPTPDAVITAVDIKAFRDAVRTDFGGPAQTIACDQLLRLCDSHEQLRADLAAARSLLREATARQFPIQDGPSIPWSAIAPHESFARINHGGQTVAHLASRGGLSVAEAIHVLEGVRWGTARSEQILSLQHDSAVEHLRTLAARAALPPETPETTNG